MGVIHIGYARLYLRIVCTNMHICAIRTYKGIFLYLKVA